MSFWTRLTKKVEAASTDVLDCLVVGAGPAGLTAGIYLGRYGRSALIIDGGNQRAAMIPTSHNYPGWPNGMHGQDLLDLMHAQNAKYGVPVEKGRVTSLQKDGDLFTGWVNGRTVTAKNVLLATGCINRRPRAIGDDDHKNGVALTLIRYCPICDGYEARNKKIVIVGSSDHGVSECLFIVNYSDDITLIPDETFGLSEGAQKVLLDQGIKIGREPLTKVALTGSNINVWTGDNPEPVAYDVLYPALGSHINTELAVQVGCTLAPDGTIVCDDHQHTNIQGLFAAGDCVEGLDQVTISQAQAAVAATAIHNSLRPTELDLEYTTIPIKNGRHQW